MLGRWELTCHRVGTGVPEEMTLPLRSNGGDGCSRQTPYAVSKASQELRTEVAGHTGRKGPLGQDPAPGTDALPACYYHESL